MIWDCSERKKHKTIRTWIIWCYCHFYLSKCALSHCLYISGKKYNSKAPGSQWVRSLWWGEWRTRHETQWGGGLIWWMLMLEDEPPDRVGAMEDSWVRLILCLPHRSPWTWVSSYRLSDPVAGPLFKRVGRGWANLSPRGLSSALACLPPPPSPPASFAFVSSASTLSEKSDAISSPGVCAGQAVGELHWNNAQLKAQGWSPGVCHAKKAKPFW